MEGEVHRSHAYSVLRISQSNRTSGIRNTKYAGEASLSHLRQSLWRSAAFLTRRHSASVHVLHVNELSLGEANSGEAAHPRLHVVDAARVDENQLVPIDGLGTGRVPADHRFFPRELVGAEVLPFPHEHLFVVLLQVLLNREVGLEPGVDEEVVLSLVVELRLPNKFGVVVGNFDVRLAAAEIALKRRDAAIHSPQVERPIVEIAQHQGLVVPPEKRTLHLLAEL